MNHAVADQVRETVIATISDLGVGKPDLLVETILLHDGFLVGRRFQFDAVKAIWFFEEEQVKFYGEDGLLKVLELDGGCRKAV